MKLRKRKQIQDSLTLTKRWGYNPQIGIWKRHARRPSLQYLITNNRYSYHPQPLKFPGSKPPRRACKTTTH